MKLLVIAGLAVVVSGLLMVAVLLGYRTDQGHVYQFMGTGIAAKLDVLGAPPSYVVIEDGAAHAVGRAAVGRDGAFVARLAPGTYRLRLPGDSRTIMVEVPNGECIDMVLDFRLPMIVLKVPAEGRPMPGLA